MLKMALFDCAINEKRLQCWRRDRAFALFFRLHPGGFDSSRVPTPGNLPSKAKNNANARGSARGGGEGLSAGGIDWCIMNLNLLCERKNWNLFGPFDTQSEYKELRGKKELRLVKTLRFLFRLIRYYSREISPVLLYNNEFLIRVY